MNATENTPPVRLLTPAELAVCIKVFRDARQWTQEQLAVIAGLNVRTVQRVERGWPADADTCRALASAFDFLDIDALSKPFAIPPEDELKAAQEQFDLEHVTFAAIRLTTGKQLAELAQTSTMDVPELAFEMGAEADKRFAALMEYFRNYRDVLDAYTEAQKREAADTMQANIDVLKTLGVSLCYAERNVLLKGGSDPDRPMPANVLYVIGFPLGKEPKLFATPTSVDIRLWVDGSGSTLASAALIRPAIRSRNGTREGREALRTSMVRSPTELDPRSRCGGESRHRAIAANCAYFSLIQDGRGLDRQYCAKTARP